jgi:hypothetical protein
MNKSKKLRLELARLLKLYSEITTDDGRTLVSEGELEIGTEVFIINENGEMTPAPSGSYVSGDTTYTVESGVITAIERKEEPIEEQPVVEGAEEEVVEVVEENNENAEEAVETIEEVVEEAVAVVEEAPEETEEDKDAKIAELEAKIAELQAIIDEYKAKEETPVVEEVVEEEFVSQKSNSMVDLIRKFRK